ncbi:hypothetical protein BRADI_3g40710v3 [Brachypodium distachyon]|uniref:Cytochrome P450 n=1 Tax=Brachypodium distachyon TaxID=15368 RepID=A0A2K2D2C7_BRADI|nr:hypothetical protein BRADI_3g40710v3 [Brachypodium distachyon]
MDQVVVVARLICTLATVVLISNALWKLLGRPYVVARSLQRQGIRGPPYRFAVGSLLEARRMLKLAPGALDANCHDYAPVVYPFFQKWTADYADTNLFQTVHYFNPSFESVLGKGMLLLDGDDWKRHLKVIHPKFNEEKLKSMSTLVLEGTRQMMEGWYTQIQNSNTDQAEIDMMHDSDELTQGVIGQLILGVNNKAYREFCIPAKEIYELLVHGMKDPPIPGFRYLPTRRNRRLAKLDKFCTSKIMQIMEARLAKGSYGEGLLGLMLEAYASDNKALSIEEIVAECKTFFMAGQDTTANLLTWAMFLLSNYPQWQKNVREEILRECPEEGEAPSTNVLKKLKLLNMFVLETLRLYNPAPFILRKTACDTNVSNIKVAKGTRIMIPVGMLHRDKEVWGPDSNEFNPMRFDKGNNISSMLAFSYGPRVCIGRDFGRIEVMSVMVMILRRFAFSLSPKYVHRPRHRVVLTPKYGLPLIVKNLQLDGPDHYD